jgi:methionine--tRNA ligase beta chain
MALKDVASFMDFVKLDIRVGTIVAAERVPNSKKLLRLEVDFGEEIGVRVIAAGIAGSYTGAFLPSRKIIAVVNLEPRTMAGIESHGMLLACKIPYPTGEQVVLVEAPGDAPNGTSIG